MTPYEILLSESQERMLVVARRGHEDAVRAILAKWDLAAAVIGRGHRGAGVPRDGRRPGRGRVPGFASGHGLPHLYADARARTSA